MTELWLKFNGRKIPVRQDKFVVGRHSECDLSIADGRLSREHLQIERFGDVFAASDLGSSNGTTVNGRKLDKPITLRNGEKLNLGGLEMDVEISSNAFSNGDLFESFDDSAEDSGGGEIAHKDAPAEIIPSLSPSKLPQSSVSISASAKTNALPKTLFIIAPVCALIVVVMVVGALMFFGRKNTEIVKKDDDFIYTRDKNTSPDTDDDEDSNVKKTPTPKPTATGEKSNTGNSNDSAGGTTPPPSPDNTDTQPTPKNQPDTAKIETGSAVFLRKISQNDPKAFLTSEQAQAISAKIKQFGNSSELADNIKSARSNSSQIQALAAGKNLKPQFIAVAALAKLGGSRGNVYQTAQGMSDVLDKLSIQLGSELADDSLLTVAVYDQGAAGDFMKTRDMLQDLSNKFPESSRTIRTIWFLHKNNKISDAEYDFALRFLAIGTIAQNPKDFNVNAEKLELN